MPRQKMIHDKIIDDSFILLTDENGKPLPACSFEIKERGSNSKANPKGITREVFVNYPSTENWDIYYSKLAEFHRRVFNDYGEINFPEQVDDWYIKRNAVQVWAVQMYTICRVKIFKDLIIELFHMLDPEIEGMNLEESRAWIMKNAGINMVFRMFQEISLVDYRIEKKNLSEETIEIFPFLTTLLSYNSSPKKPDSASSKSSKNLSSLANSSYLGTPSTTVN